MIRFRLAAAVAAGFLALSGTLAAAAPLQLVTTFDLTTRGNGPDTPGLDGASVKLTALFADGTLFTRDGFATPRAVASSVFVDIMGASVAGTNGTYTPNQTLGLFATGNTNDGYLTSGPSTNVFVPGGDGTFFGIGNLVNQVRLSAGGTVGSAAVGDMLTLSRLQGVDIGAGGTLLFSKSGPGGTGYDMSNFATMASEVVAPIPLPAGLPLLAAALGGLALLRRRRSA